nr:hypothetical protein BdHM001_36530 [Bdellovibrio sp. HM001]
MGQMKCYIVPYESDSGDTGVSYGSVEELFSSPSAASLGYLFKVLTDSGDVLYDPRCQCRDFFESLKAPNHKRTDVSFSIGDSRALERNVSESAKAKLLQ